MRTGFGIRRGFRTLAAATLAIATVAAGLRAGSSAAAPARKVVEDASPTAVAKREPGKARGEIDFSVVLGWRHARALATLDRAVSDPSSPGYAHHLTPAQF